MNIISYICVKVNSNRANKCKNFKLTKFCYVSCKKDIFLLYNIKGYNANTYKEDRMKNIVENKRFGEERALYALRDAEVIHCSFEGEEDGESALKETRRIKVSDCDFRLRYPLWHTEDFEIKGSSFCDTARAPIWYARRGMVSDSTLTCIKALRECDSVSFEHSDIISEEFGWKSSNISLSDCKLSGAYAFLDCKNVSAKRLRFSGKYSFQYVNGLVIEDSYLDTKDAFWHSKNVTVRNSTVKGEYLAWFSESLTLENCRIIGTQPLCYCKDLRLINCEMTDCDLSFENSHVLADVKGHIVSVKNPISGNIIADSIGEIIFDENASAPGAAVSVRNK